MFLALRFYVAQLKCLSGVSNPHEKTMTGQKHLFLLLITDADYLFTAPLRRPQLCFASFIHKQWSHDPPDLSYIPFAGGLTSIGCKQMD